ncbi:hypothetical protein ACFFRE_02930 [Aciditerrimonas ferrireducens]|uniref:Uncharacterized protein n=1 Tax=Aciditerrimonas ferrireducens TaxID=667306 RepID=A0ABV6C0A6_9ACTN
MIRATAPSCTASSSGSGPGGSALFDLTAILLVLLANDIVQNRDSVNAEEAWTKKLRLEEACVFAFGLVEAGIGHYLQRTGDRTLAGAGNEPMVRYARQMLKEALEDARKTGLHRVLSLISAANGEDDLGKLLTQAEAILLQDLATENPVFSGAMASLLVQTSLLEQLGAVTFDDIAGFWGKPWPALGEIRQVVGQVVEATGVAAPSGPCP